MAQEPLRLFANIFSSVTMVPLKPLGFEASGSTCHEYTGRSASAPCLKCFLSSRSSEENQNNRRCWKTWAKT